MDDLAVEGIQSGERIEAWGAIGLVPSLTRVSHALCVGVRAYLLAHVQGDPHHHRRGGETVAIESGKQPLATAAAALKDLKHILVARTASSVLLR